MAQIHASCIAIGEYGVLLSGPSGAGKSDLALRLIDDGAELVADDRVELRSEDGKLIAAAPENIRDLIEVRGLGIVEIPAVTDVKITLMVDLSNAEKIDRLPEYTTTIIEGINVRTLKLRPFDISTPAKIRLALNHPLHKPNVLLASQD